MSLDARIRTILLSAAILIAGIIHLGVGIGIVSKYHKFGDTFQQQVSLSGYNVFIGLVTIAVGIVGLAAVIKQSPFLTKITVPLAFVLGIFVLGSLIAALALSGQSASYLHDSLTDNMNSYAEDDDSISTIDSIQTTYQCCGVNLWLDWARIDLGSSTGINNGRRRRHLSPPVISPLTRALRRKRQSYTSSGYVYNLPYSYSVNLPLSCCKSGGTTNGNSLGGYCVFSASNGTSSFYVSGCMEPVANIAFAQITGIAVINTFLTILAFVYFAKLVSVFRSITDPNNPHYVHPNQTGVNQSQQQEQYSYGPYYINDSNRNSYYVPNDPNSYYIPGDQNYKMYL